MSSGLGGLGLYHPSRPHFPPPGPEYANASKPRAGGASPKWVIFCSSALPAGCEGQDGPTRPPGGETKDGADGNKKVGAKNPSAHSAVRIPLYGGRTQDRSRQHSSDGIGPKHARGPAVLVHENRLGPGHPSGRPSPLVLSSGRRSALLPSFRPMRTSPRFA